MRLESGAKKGNARSDNGEGSNNKFINSAAEGAQGDASSGARLKAQQTKRRSHMKRAKSASRRQSMASSGGSARLARKRKREKTRLEKGEQKRVRG